MSKIVYTVPFFWFFLSTPAFAQNTGDPTEQKLFLYLMAGLPILFYLALVIIFGDYRDLIRKKRALILVSKSSGKVLTIKQCRKISKAKKHLTL